jgi:hypothetical protein
MSYKWEVHATQKVLRYDPKRYYATCPFCNDTHRSWWFDGEMVGDMTNEAWMCARCKKRTSDEGMQICNKQGNPVQAKVSMQKVIYKDFTKTMANIDK